MKQWNTLPDWSSCLRLNRNAVKIYKRLVLVHNIWLSLHTGGSPRWGSGGDFSRSLLFLFILFHPVRVVDTRGCYGGDHNTADYAENYHYKYVHCAIICNKKEKRKRQPSP